MTTNVNIIRIGNSLGIILPTRFIRELEAKERDVLELDARGGRILISNPLKTKDPFRNISKGGWYGIPEDDADRLSSFLHDSRLNEREIPVL